MKRIIKLTVSFYLFFLLFSVSAFAGEIIEAECSGESESKKIFILLDSDGGKTNVMGTDLDLVITKDKAIMTSEKNPGQMILDFKNGNMIINGEKFGFCKFSNLEVLGMENTEDATSDAEKVEQEKTNIDDADSGDTEVEIIQLLESMKTQLNKLEKKLDTLNLQVKGVKVSDVSDSGNGGKSKSHSSGVYEAKCGLVYYDYYNDYDYDQFVIIAKSLGGGSIVLDDFNDGDWQDENIIGIEAIVSGNGNQATFTGNAMYRKMGNRLEIYGDDTPIQTNVDEEQFQEYFGLFPTVTCTAG